MKREEKIIKKELVTTSIIFLIIIINLCGCIENDFDNNNSNNGVIDSRFFGKWEIYDTVYDLKSNGSYYFSDLGVYFRYVGTWKVIDNQFCFVRNGEKNCYRFEFLNNENELSIYFDENKSPQVWTKIWKKYLHVLFAFF